MPEIRAGISFEQVVREVGVHPIIFYAVGTCWWTHRRIDLHRHRDSGLPCDPRGSMLWQTDEAIAFLEQSRQNVEHYGKWGLRTFMAAHHLNCVVSGSGLKKFIPTSMCGWDKYNAALDRADEKIIASLVEDLEKAMSVPVSDARRTCGGNGSG